MDRKFFIDRLLSMWPETQDEKDCRVSTTRAAELRGYRHRSSPPPADGASSPCAQQGRDDVPGQSGNPLAPKLL